MGFRVRQADLRDLPLLMEWRMQVLREVFCIPKGQDMTSLEQANRRYYERHLADGGHTACFCVEEGTGEIVGCGGICYQEEMPSPDNGSGLCGYLMNIFTLPPWRGRGAGRSTVAFLMQDARARGVEKLYLETSDSGRPLYRRLGFTEMRDYLIRHLPGEGQV